MTELQPINFDFHAFDPAAFVNPIIGTLNRIIPQIPSLIIGLIMAVLLIRIVSRVTKMALRLTTLSPALRGIIAGAVSLSLWVIVLMQLLQAMGFGNIVIFFTTSVAAIGIVMAAGGSTLFSDVAAGAYLANNRNFGQGDEVIVHEFQGAPECRGRIESMDMRRTTLRDEKGRLHILPNAFLERRDVTLVDVGRSKPLTKVVAKKIRKTAKSVVAGKVAPKRVVKKPESMKDL